MYTLILILAQGVTPIGTYNSLQECQESMKQFQQKDIVVGCVLQKSPEEEIEQARKFFNAFQSIVGKFQ